MTQCLEPSRFCQHGTFHAATNLDGIEKFPGKSGLYHLPPGEPFPQQLFRQGKAAVRVAAPQRHRHALHPVPLCPGGNAPALAFAVTRLKADAGLIRPGKGILVHQFGGVAPEKIPPGAEIFPETVLFRQSAAEPCQICRRGIRPVVRAALGTGEPGVTHPQVKGTGVHVHDKGLRIAARSHGKHNSGIVGVPHDQPFSRSPTVISSPAVSQITAPFVPVTASVAVRTVSAVQFPCSTCSAAR